MIYPNMRKSKGFLEKKLLILYARIITFGLTKLWNFDVFCKNLVLLRASLTRRKVKSRIQFTVHLFYGSFVPTDPEEFLHCLLSQTLRAEPFLKLNSGQEAYHHQLFVEKDDKLVMPTVQQLFEQSFLSSGIKLKEVTVNKTWSLSKFVLMIIIPLGSTCPNYSNASLRQVL